MKPAPHDWPRLSSSLVCQNPLKMIDWFVAAMDFEIKIKILDDDGNHVHSELIYGGCLISVMSEEFGDKMRWGVPFLSPLSNGGANTQILQLYVEDVVSHCEKVREHGGIIITEPMITDYGPEYWSDKLYAFHDPEGHLWWITERLRG